MSLQAFAITVSISKSVFSSYHQQIGSEKHRLFTKPPTDYRWRQLEMKRWKWDVSLLKQHNFGIFRYNSIKLCGKVYILLLNSCVKFYAKIDRRCWYINQLSHKGLLFYVHPVYDRLVLLLGELGKFTDICDWSIPKILLGPLFWSY